MRNTALIFVIALSLFFPSFSIAAPFIIDDFNISPTNVDANSGNAPQSMIGGGGSVVGGSRTLSVDTVNGVGFLNLLMTNNTNPNQLRFSADALTSGSGSVTWDADGAGLGGVDLTVDGNNAFFLNILAIDVGQITLGFVVEDIYGNISSFGPEAFGVGQQLIPFSDFTNNTPDPALFDMVDSIQLTLEISPDATTDVRINQPFQTVNINEIPEPFSGLMWLTMMSGGGVAAWVFRRKKGLLKS